NRSKQTASYHCHESQALSLVDALVLRLILSLDVPVFQTPVIEEDQPAFHIGDSVVVMLNEHNRTPRQGKVAQIVRHWKKRRYYYFLEVGGKLINRRYYSDDLKQA